MSYDFQTTTHGKWILTGEHAVIRGHAALVFPIHEKKLVLKHDNTSQTLSADYEGEHGTDTHLLFWSVLEQGMQLLGRSLNDLKGHFNVYSNIPVGVGMGASAALCVATARWFVAQNMIQETQLHEFAKQLEHLFHGQSSGLDIAGVAATSGVYFKQGEFSILNPTWRPHWTLSSCGQIGITSHCIQQVQSQREQDPLRGESIDKQMAASVKLACLALEQHTPKSQIQLAEAIHAAADCFQQWGLVNECLQGHMHQLTKAGALAVKPTGSGGGGYVISLWESKPPKLPFELLNVGKIINKRS